MSLVNDALWQSEFPDIPKPGDVEYMDFLRLCQEKSDREHREWTLDFIKTLQDRRDHPDTSAESKVFYQELIDQEVEMLDL